MEYSIPVTDIRPRRDLHTFRITCKILGQQEASNWVYRSTRTASYTNLDVRHQQQRASRAGDIQGSISSSGSSTRFSRVRLLFMQLTVEKMPPWARTCVRDSWIGRDVVGAVPQSKGEHTIKNWHGRRSAQETQRDTMCENVLTSGNPKFGCLLASMMCQSERLTAAFQRAKVSEDHRWLNGAWER